MTARHVEISRHRVPSSMLMELATGGGGPAVIRSLRRANRSKTLLSIRLIAMETVRLRHPATPVVQAAYRTLGELREQAPDLTDRVLDDPAVAMWAIATARGVAAAQVARPDALAQIAVAAAVRVGASVDLPLIRGQALQLPSLGTVHVSGSAVRVRPDGAGVVVSAGGRSVRIPSDFTLPSPGWRPMATVRLAERPVPLEDWAFTPLPGHFGAEPRTVGDEVGSWTERLTTSLRLLERHGSADAVAETVMSIGPLRDSRSGKLNSATLADGFGCVLMTLPSDALTGAVTLVHEVQHNKLAALLDVIPLLESDPRQRFYAPWRPDPRPLLGLLHGAYAHLGVVGFWQLQRRFEHDRNSRFTAEVEFARWLRATVDTVDLIQSRSELTDNGREFTGRMAKTLADWSAEPVSASARALAERLNRAHRSRSYAE